MTIRTVEAYSIGSDDSSVSDPELANAITVDVAADVLITEETDVSIARD